MVVAIHQPEHMPWLGFFNKMIKSDFFVIMDSVQFKKNDFQNRNRVLGTNGPQWITVPVEMNNHMNTNIKDIRIANTTELNWRKKYLRTLEESYKKCPYFNNIFENINRIFEVEQSMLCELNIKVIIYFAELLNIKPQFIRSSDLDVSGTKSDLVLNICKALNAQIYISGTGGRGYMNLKSFEENNITVKFNEYEHPVYVQKKMKGCTEFIPYMSVFDMLMCNDPIEANRILKKG